jgi:hypothetical protein
MQFDSGMSSVRFFLQRGMKKTLVPFMHVLTQFIALTEIDDFAYCAVGFMVYSLFTLKARESFQLVLELLQQQATSRTSFQYPYVHKHISSLERDRSHFR